MIELACTNACTRTRQLVWCARDNVRVTNNKRSHKRGCTTTQSTHLWFLNNLNLHTICVIVLHKSLKGCLCDFGGWKGNGDKLESTSGNPHSQQPPVGGIRNLPPHSTTTMAPRISICMNEWLQQLLVNYCKGQSIHYVIQIYKYCNKGRHQWRKKRIFWKRAKNFRHC